MPSGEDGVELALAPATTDVLAGVSLPVSTELRNTADVPAEIVSGVVSKLTFAFRQADGPARFALSAEHALRETMGDRRFAEPEPVREELAPGAVRSNVEDLAAYTPAPLAPGRYTVTARFPMSDGVDCISNDVAVTVHPPRVGRFAQAYCPQTGFQAQAFEHAAPAGARVVYHRDTGDERADDGTFRRRITLQGEDSLTGLAVAVHADPALDGRYVAWLRAGAFGALVGWGDATPAVPPALPLELTDAVLVEPGFQLAAADASDSICEHGAAVFFVLGLRDGAVCAQALRVTATEVRPGAPVALGGGNVPASVLATFLPASRTVLLAWAVEAHGGTTVWSLEFTLEGELVSSSPRALYTRAAPLAALALAPLDLDGPPAVHALFGPEGAIPEVRTLCYARAGLAADAAPPEEHTLGILDHSAARYAISGLATGELLVLGATPRVIAYTAARTAGAWGVLTETQLADAPRLWAATSTRYYWAALWIDPARGVLCAADPAYSRER